MATDDWRKMNAQFYDGPPSEYFRERLRFLVLRASKPEALAEALGHTLEWGQIRIRHEPEDAVDLATAEMATARFVAIESQVLFHHVGETVLRWFLAHETRPDCPWIELAALLDFKVFRAHVDDLAKSAWRPDRIRAVEFVFFGSEFRDDMPAEFIEARDATVRLLQLIARRLTNDKNLYNATKHGATAIGGKSQLAFVPDHAGVDPSEPGALTQEVFNEHALGAAGHAVDYLEGEKKSKTRTWYRVTQWVRPQQSAMLTHLALVLIDMMWTMARVHYLGEDPPAQMDIIRNQDIENYLHMGSTEGGPITTFRVQVATQRSK